MEAFLPKMTLPVMHLVYASRIASMRSSQQSCERVLVVRNQYQMNMIRHQAVCQDDCIRLWQLVCEQIEVC
jgi:hypothetical protein